MTRDAEMTASDFVTLVLRQHRHARPTRSASRAIPSYAAAGDQPLLRTRRAATSSARRWETGVRELLMAAEPGSDHQLTFARAYAAAAALRAGTSPTSQGLLDGSLVIDGLDIDTDLRWALVIGLARAGAADEARIDEELERDHTISGQEHAAAARASRPDRRRQGARPGQTSLENPDVPNETHRSIAVAFMRHGQEDAARAVRREVPRGGRRHLGAARHPHGVERARGRLPASRWAARALRRAARPLARRVARQPGAKRYVREGRADVVRALAAQAKDAQG